MKALADALDLPCGYFLRPLKFQMETVRFRKKERVSGKMEKRIEQVASDLIERYIEVEEICGARCEEKFRRYDVGYRVGKAG